MLRRAEILIGVVADTFRWLRLSVRSSRSIKAENLLLRRQLALYIERGVKPRRIDLVTRIGLTLLSRCFLDGGSAADVDPLAPSGMEVVLASEVPPRPTADPR
jgi:hypothetical protein